MACGRPKNLEIAARNPLCSPGDRRKNFFTTRDGNRRRGNPEPPGKGQLRAFGPREVRRHRQGGNSEPPVRGKPRATRYWANSGASGPGKARCHLARGEPARRNLGPVAQGRLRGLWRRGNPASCAEKKALGRRRKGKLQMGRRRGNPESRDEKKALSHRAKGKLDPCDLGETPVIW